MKMKKKTYDDDDGRVISKMNIDGMPWYMRLGRREESEEEKDFSDLTKGETWHIILGTVKAALLVGAVYFVVFLLFILFCVFIWFR